MRRILRFRERALGAIPVLLFLLPGNLHAQLVDNQLTGELRRIFPELVTSYIDLNANGRPDRNEDLDEYVADSAVKDGQLQAREVLAFIVRSYAFIPADTLRKVLGVLEKPVGTFAELISLEYRSRIEEAVRLKEELDERGLFLTPSARREALERISGYLSTLVTSYGREARSLEPEFVTARDALFTMIERGYPLPDDLGPENTAILQSIMINTVVRERGQSPARVRVAVKTLGRLKSATAIGHLVELLSDADLKRAAISALGEIAQPEALAVLTSELGKRNDTPTRVELVHAIGRVGDRGSITRLQELLKTEGGVGPEPEITLAVLEALVFIVESGNPDVAALPTFQEHIGSPVQRLRVLAVRGLSAYPQNLRVADLLFPLLTERQPEEVTIAVIRAVNGLNSPKTVPALVTILRSSGAGETVQEAAVRALGSNPNGLQALATIVGALESPSENVGRAAEDALIVLYGKQPDQIVAAVGRTLTRTTEPATLTRGTAVLSRLADATSLPFLAPLLQNPHTEVKTNVTWALYRIRSAANPRAMEDLKTLVKSESEALQVRINAVRALGAIRTDTPQLRVWEVLTTTARMTGEKYSMLRYYAVQALGELGRPTDEVIDTLVRIVGRDTNPGIVKQAVGALQTLAVGNATVEEALTRAFRRNQEMETRIRVVEALGDLRSAALPELAAPLLAQEVDPELKKRTVAALSQVGGQVSLGLILDAARDQRLVDYVKGVLGDADRATLRTVLAGRARSESDPQVATVVQDLLTEIDETL
jgi:HEAT repeat protein